VRRLRPFAYHRPASLAEAIGILGEAGSRPLAGGTDLVVDMKTGRMRPPVVVDLKRIPGLAGIEAAPGGIRIGALTSVRAVEQSGLVRERHPALAGAAAVLATPPVRGLATVGGNIGRASPASDLAPPLIVLGAVAEISGRSGHRREPVEALFRGPGITTLAPDDVITAVFVPDAPVRFGAVHLKLGARGGGTDIAVVGVCAGVALTAGGVVDRARIVLASVAPTPLRAREAEALLEGARPGEERLAAAAEAAAAATSPIGDSRGSAGYRVALSGVLTGRALRAALSAAGGVA
jgi:carbon-monoxide dehydrogenase medium subunit